MRLFDVDPGQAVAEEILPLALMLRLRPDLQGGDMDALAGAIDRHQAQHVVRVRHRRRIDAGRRLADVVDHASAPQAVSERSLLAR